MKETVVPEQEQGSSLDIEFSFDAGSASEARKAFRCSAARLLNVNDWDTLCGAASAKFEITDHRGIATGAAAREGQFFKISIPAPGPAKGDGFDWVRVETIKVSRVPSRDEEQVSMRVRPAPHPGKEESSIAHFFGPEATSTFRVSRNRLQVTASVHGRNEKANNETESVVDKVRNAVVSIGARVGMSAMQWRSLVKGIIEGPPR